MLRGDAPLRGRSSGCLPAPCGLPRAAAVWRGRLESSFMSMLGSRTADDNPSALPSHFLFPPQLKAGSSGPMSESLTQSYKNTN
jgi:hypothetical protein